MNELFTTVRPNHVQFNQKGVASHPCSSQCRNDAGSSADSTAKVATLDNTREGRREGGQVVLEPPEVKGKKKREWVRGQDASTSTDRCFLKSSRRIYRRGFCIVNEHFKIVTFKWRDLGYSYGSRPPSAGITLRTLNALLSLQVLWRNCETFFPSSPGGSHITPSKDVGLILLQIPFLIIQLVHFTTYALTVHEETENEGVLDDKGNVLITKYHVLSTSLFYNYKRTRSIVVSAVVDEDYCFRYIHFCSDGRICDSAMFPNPTLNAAMENGLLLAYTRRVCLFVEAFFLRPYLLRSCIYRGHATEQKVFNYKSSMAPALAENAFDIRASRFRVFRTPIFLHVKTTKTAGEKKTRVPLSIKMSTGEISHGESRNVPTTIYTSNGYLNLQQLQE
ncbi:hypothetical protein PR048_016777 [Dryococelus australis]|uniref:DDE Tnp4 domain-containing protein n=1 Tax=Dryococelus australis TaxID=614101 RepID=A0ABQ9H7V2_9NEOP|nr:hypothetical protein PR048_016777 [Dryococelus australis]